MFLVMIVVALGYFCVKYKAKVDSKKHKVGDFNVRAKQRRLRACVPLISESRLRAVPRRWLVE